VWARSQGEKGPTRKDKAGKELDRGATHTVVENTAVLMIGTQRIKEEKKRGKYSKNVCAPDKPWGPFSQNRPPEDGPRKGPVHRPRERLE